MAEQIEILRRIAERGLRLAQLRNDGHMMDLWQHMLDEIERTRLVLDQGAGIEPAFTDSKSGVLPELDEP